MIFLAGALVMNYSKTHPTEAAKENPFVKIGTLATKNGVVAEVFNMGDCYILVTTMPNEYGKGSYQLECK